MNRSIPMAVVCAFALVVSVHAQDKGQEWVAVGGPAGIFVNLGDPVPGLSDVAAYVVERKPAAGGAWDTVFHSIEGPKNEREFAKRLAKAEGVLAPVIPHQTVPADFLWKKIAATPSVDLLKRWGGALSVRLAMGVSAFDSTATRGTNYEYRVTQLLKNGKPGESVSSLLAAWPEKPEAIRMKAIGREDNEHVIRVSWQRVASQKPAIWKAMRAEGSGEEPLALCEKAAIILQPGKDDSLRITVIDTTVTPGKIYRYSLATYDYYGNPLAGADTMLAAAFPFYRVITPQHIAVESSDSLHGLRIRWHLDDPKNVHSVKIQRSAMWDSGFTGLIELPATVTDYVDQSVKPMQKYFYRMTITDAIGDESPPTARVFGLYRDQTPPLPLALRTGPEVKNGVGLVIVRTDPAVKIYRVYRNEGYGTAFSPVSGPMVLTDSEAVFSDTGNSLRALVSYGYVVQGESASHMLGPASDTVYAQPKIAVKLYPPPSLTAKIAGGGVSLFWPDARPMNPAMSGYLVFRKALDSADPVQLTASVLLVNQNHFFDSTVASGTSYDYFVKCVDAFGMQSAPGSSASASVPTRRPLSPAAIHALPLTGGVVISWDEPLDSNVVSYNIYRYERGSADELIGKKEKGESQFTDMLLPGAGLRFYYVTSMTSGGVESKHSPEASVRR